MRRFDDADGTINIILDQPIEIKRWKNNQPSRRCKSTSLGLLRYKNASNLLEKALQQAGNIGQQTLN